ncbi:hypothetical protein FB390_2475 [Nocardia bhagyanarayanae]|uniref:Uncharacterized protein n=1 Tax=Nocardia bhagyanarayanae TaxID=1215925 RepID=A0A543FAI6_9NOCA|nr:hypothetical protein FB390_2475 [Nocardia bhagyanarayanae]
MPEETGVCQATSIAESYGGGRGSGGCGPFPAPGPAGALRPRRTLSGRAMVIGRAVRRVCARGGTDGVGPSDVAEPSAPPAVEDVCRGGVPALARPVLDGADWSCGKVFRPPDPASGDCSAAGPGEEASGRAAPTDGFDRPAPFEDDDVSDRPAPVGRPWIGRAPPAEGEDVFDCPAPALGAAACSAVAPWDEAAGRAVPTDGDDVFDPPAPVEGNDVSPRPAPVGRPWIGRAPPAEGEDVFDCPAPALGAAACPAPVPGAPACPAPVPGVIACSPSPVGMAASSGSGSVRGRPVGRPTCGGPAWDRSLTECEGLVRGRGAAGCGYGAVPCGPAPRVRSTARCGPMGAPVCGGKPFRLGPGRSAGRRCPGTPAWCGEPVCGSEFACGGTFLDGALSA